MPAGVAHGVVGDHVPADEDALIVGVIADGVGDGVEVMAVADFVDQAVVDGVVVAAQMEPRAALMRTLQLRNELSCPPTKMPVSPEVVVLRPCSIWPKPYWRVKCETYEK